jgi:hypothetical protein
MKKTPQEQKLEEILRSSKLVADGFMGEDPRDLAEIIEQDLAAVIRLGYSVEQIAARMREITSQAITGLGMWVQIGPNRQAKVDEAKGTIPCPWPHPSRFAKRVTTLQHLDTRATVIWADLNIHMIAEHAFFEGKGSHFRLEPETLITMIF